MSARAHTPINYPWLFRKLPTMATSIGADGSYRDLNDAFLARLGYEREQMVGHRPAEFVTDESAERLEKELLPTLRRTGRLENKVIQFRSRSGEVVDCLTNSIVEFDADGRLVGTISVYVEVTEQARIDRKYRDLYRSTPAMLHTVDANGFIATVTDHWLQKMGYQREEVVGRPVVDFYSEADRRRLGGGRKDPLLDNEFMNQKRQMVTRDGRVLDLVMSAVFHRDEQGRVLRRLVASKDVTERNRAERELRIALAENARLREELEHERDYLREEVNVSMNFGRIVGRSPALRQMLSKVEAVAQTPANVLILGESGVGKELVARAIHAQSTRAEAPLVKVNCASIPKELFESEFFGHVKGAFTGAHKDRVGRFQLADGGTIFLDEIGEIPLELQGKLLRVLQESEFERVGDDITRTVDVRVIAATNRDLEELVLEGRFREDLFYRLSVFPIRVPPLRERRDDVVQLAQHFLDATLRDFGREPVSLTQQQVESLRSYDWPGNVRELKNVIERAVILSRDGRLRLDLGKSDAPAIPEGLEGAGAPGADREAQKDDILTEDEMKAFQRRNMLRALERSGWKVSGKDGAAALLGLRPTTLADRIRAFDLKKPAA
ncbi:MAG: sigma 54-interacting transcriptional regulator [Woeseiaceae bacterium]|nr:sigma 54-interacting transcriptional regulator [Woeseiaceae bacterium]